ncbi:MAG: glycosyltransferase family 2 protein [Pseudomonadota bacterium]
MSELATPRVLVVLLNYRTAEMTLRAAQAALAAMPDAGAELVIVDNASGDGSEVVLGQAIKARGWDENGRVRLIVSPVNGGFGAGNNIGFAAAMSDGQPPDYYYVLNSDAFPEPDCLGRLIRHLEAHENAGIVGAHVRGEDDVTHTVAFRFPSIAGEFEAAARTGPITRLLRRSVVAMPVPEHVQQVDWVVGCSVLLRAEMLTSIGTFDETFFLYFEETDLCRRAKRAGWDCWYLPEARVVHIGSVSTGMKTWARTPQFWFESRRHYFCKNHGRAYAAGAWLARLAGGAIHLTRCALSGAQHQDPPGFYRDLLRFGLNLPRRADPVQPLAKPESSL